MSVLQHVLKEELARLEQLAEKYKDDINKLPRGALSQKMRNGKAYLYRAYREKDKVKFQYIGRESSDAAKQALRKREQRLKIESNLRQVMREIKEIKRALHGRG